MGCFQFEPRGDALERLLHHTPLGAAWVAFRVECTKAYSFWQSVAAGLNDLDVALCRMIHEFDPRTTDELISEWETSVSLPDPCLPAASDLQERRNWVMFRLNKKRWTTAQDWIDLAKLFGLTITVTPGWLVQKPALFRSCFPVRFDLFPKLGRFRVYIDIAGYKGGGFAYGDPNNGDDFPIPFGPDGDDFSNFKCLIERVKPANVIVLWNLNPDTCDGNA